jgi:hypothetical protein
LTTKQLSYGLNDGASNIEPLYLLGFSIYREGFVDADSFLRMIFAAFLSKGSFSFLYALSVLQNPSNPQIVRENLQNWKITDSDTQAKVAATTK